MTAHALSESWLTDPISWDDSIDVPFIAGTRVRIQERKVIQWDKKPRHGFLIWIGDSPESHSSVIVVEHPDRVTFTCSDHNDWCDCKHVARMYMEACK